MGHIQSVEGLKSEDLRFPLKEEILPLDWNIEILPWADKLQTLIWISRLPYRLWIWQLPQWYEPVYINIGSYGSYVYRFTPLALFLWGSLMKTVSSRPLSRVSEYLSWASSESRQGRCSSSIWGLEPTVTVSFLRKRKSTTSPRSYMPALPSLLLIQQMSGTFYQHW